jgi:pimeloyl-ACP methyl ester carboxylesterase
MSTQETALTSYVEVNGINIAYRVIGVPVEGTVPLLVLNHFRSNIDLWDPLLINALVAGGRQVITYDYAGLGHSAGEIELTIKGFAANVIAFLAAVLPSLNSSVVDLMGFSMGGYVVQQVALDAPELIRKIVLSGTGPSGNVGPFVTKPMAEVQSTIMSDPPNGQGITDAFFPSFIAKEAGGEWINRIMSGRANIAGKNGEPEFVSFLSGPTLSRLVEAYLKWDADPLPFAFLQTIQKDALVTAGSNDLIVPTQNSYQLSRQLPRAHFVVYPGSGHGHLFQYAKFYAKQVTEFLNGDWPVPPYSAGSLPRKN